MRFFRKALGCLSSSLATHLPLVKAVKIRALILMLGNSPHWFLGPKARLRLAVTRARKNGSAAAVWYVPPARAADFLTFRFCDTGRSKCTSVPKISKILAASLGT